MRTLLIMAVVFGFFINGWGLLMVLRDLMDTETTEEGAAASSEGHLGEMPRTKR
jgi:hypothetical protein